MMYTRLSEITIKHFVNANTKRNKGMPVDKSIFLLQFLRILADSKYYTYIMFALQIDLF